MAIRQIASLRLWQYWLTSAALRRRAARTKRAAPISQAMSCRAERLATRSLVARKLHDSATRARRKLVRSRAAAAAAVAARAADAVGLPATRAANQLDEIWVPSDFETELEDTDTEAEV